MVPWNGLLMTTGNVYTRYKAETREESETDGWNDSKDVLITGTCERGGRRVACPQHLEHLQRKGHERRVRRHRVDQRGAAQGWRFEGGGPVNRCRQWRSPASLGGQRVTRRRWLLTICRRGSRNLCREELGSSSPFGQVDSP